MKLKIKLLKWSAGLPVAMIHQKVANEIGFQPKERLLIKTSGKRKREFSTITDIIQGLIKPRELGVSLELKEMLGLRIGQVVDVNLTEVPKSMIYVKKKLQGKKWKKKHIKEIIKDIVNNSISEPEIAMFVSAMYDKGMTFKETVYLVEAILDYANTLNFRSDNVVDKHCIGGIPGNRTTPLVVSICAAAGLIFPKSSSRAITSAAGTADVIEAIARIEFSVEELKKIVKKTGACMVWGGTADLVPADSKIIKLEKLLKLDPEAQMLASIVSKKLAAGSKHILIDIPYGNNAKVDKKRGKKLAKKFRRIGRYFKRDFKVVLTRGDEPIGNGIGPILELRDIIKVLDSKVQGPKDLEEKAIFLSGKLLEMTNKAKKGEGEILAKHILISGKAFEKFKEIIKAQDGKIGKLPVGKFEKTIYAKRRGKIKLLHNKDLNSLARVAGCPMDKKAGVYLYGHLGDVMKKGDRLLTIYSDNKERLKKAEKFYKKVRPVKLE